MSNIFQTVPRARVPRSTFDLSHSRKLSMKLGQLVPVLCQEVVPGDSFNISTESMIRLAPMIAPVMHRMHAYMHFFYVPNRILCREWEDIITNAQELTVPTAPVLTVSVGGLADHLGIPPGDWDGTTSINILPFLAYFQIWNDYYRDENLQSEIDIFDPAFQAQIVKENLKFSAWEKDYFTSALKSPQAGTKVTMSANVFYKETFLRDQNGGTPQTGVNLQTKLIPGSPVQVGVVAATATNNLLNVENLQEVTLDVEELRRATRLQRWLERNARSGSRYVETLLAHFNIKSSDARIQRAEYLGGGKTPVIISDVANMTGTATAPQGTLSGNGLSIGQSNRANKFCEEHGYIIAIMKVLPETAYAQEFRNTLPGKLIWTIIGLNSPS